MLERLWNGGVTGADDEVGPHGRFKASLRAGHARHLLGGGFGVEAFHIARDANFERAVDVDEAHMLAKYLPHEIAVMLFRRDEGADDGVALIGEQLRQVRGTAQVFAAVGIAEAKIGAEAGAEVIAIEEYDRSACGLQMITQGS